MGEHDQNFKRLLRTFFRPFPGAFTPDLHAAIESQSVQFVDKELVQGSTRAQAKIVDLVARVRLRGAPSFVLVHVEHQSSREKPIGRRLLAYAAGLMEQSGLPVYSILLTSYEQPSTPEPTDLVVDVLGWRILEFHYRVIQLNRLNWRQFLRLRNPAATALMVKMNIRPEDRVKAKAQILRLLVTMRLDRRKMDFIAGFVERYLALTAKEELALRRELDKVLTVQQKSTAMQLITSWERRGREEGLKEGLEEGLEKGRREERISIVKRLLIQRLGPVPAALVRRVERLESQHLQDLTLALLEFGTVAELRDWLEHVKTSARQCTAG